MQYTTDMPSRQFALAADILHDTDDRGRIRPWAQHKSEAQLLALAYEAAGNAARAARVRECARTLAYTLHDGKLALASASFCRCRLCPICQWRRSLKVYAQSRAVAAYLEQRASAAGRKPPNYVLLTLTIPNISAQLLRGAIQSLHAAWQRLTQRAEVRAMLLGWQRATEITYSPHRGDYHPHIHAVLCVRPSYYKSRYYIPHARWLELWREAMRDDSITQVDIRRTYGTPEQAAAEIAKYATKPGDYLDASDIDAMVERVDELDAALANMRMMAYGGCMREAHAALELDDVEAGNLIHTGVDEDAAARAADPTLYWSWAAGRKQYIRDRSLER